MMKKLVFVTPPDAGFGFGLCGVRQRVADPLDAETVLRQEMAEPGLGLVILDERLHRSLSEERLRELEHGWNGILLALPAPEKLPAEVEDYAARLITRAIGYHVRLKV